MQPKGSVEKQLQDWTRPKCANCIYFHTPKCSFGEDYTLVRPEDRPCSDGLLAIPFGSDLIIQQGKQQLIIPARFLTAKSTKTKLLERFQLELYEIEPTIIRIKKLISRKKKPVKQTPIPHEDPKIKQAAEQLLKDPDMLDKFIQHSNRWIVHDIPTRKIELLTCISTLGDYPLNLALQQVWSAGKTKTITTVASYFEDKDVWFLGGMSPKTLIHERGDYSEDTDKFIIDLQNKILIFLDEPQFETLNMLKPLLSHDKFEIDYRYVHKDTMKTVVSTLRGWPACVFCAVKSKYTEEFTSRWFTASPEVNIQKIKKVITLKGEAAATPEKYLKDKQFKIWKKAFSLLKKKAPYKLVIPYAKTLSQHYNAKKPAHMRFYDLLLALIKASCILHAEQRKKDEKERLIATLEDYETAKNIFQIIEKPTIYGIGQNVLDFYQNIILQTKRDWDTYESLMNKYQETTSEPLNRNTLRENYLKPLEKAGLIDVAPDPEDKRKKRITITTTTEQPSLIDDEGFRQAVKELL